MTGATSATRELATFLAEAPDTDLPPRLYGLARRYLLDTLGVAVFGAGLPWSRLAAAAGRRAGEAGGAGCTVIGEPWRATPPAAAFVNGAFGHAFELDDVHDETILHPGTVVVPAALAVAEDTGASGHDLLTAVIAGYEAMARAGLAVGPSTHMLHGFHPTGTSGVFGSAAAAGRLLGLDGAAMTGAFGIAASFAGGVMQFSQTGGMVKRIHGGRAAEGGVQAAYLARDGFEGPDGGLDGRFGFCRVFSPRPRLEMLTEALGRRFMIDEITVKPYACCSDVHPIIDALLEIKAAHDPDPEAIAAIEVEAPTKVAEQNALDGTTSIMAAQYSAKFTAAATLLRDIRDPRLYDETALADPAIRRLHDKVAIARSGEFDRTYAWKISARVRVRMADGRVHEATVEAARGSTHRPLSQDEVEDKVRMLAGEALGAERAEAMIATVAALDDAPDVAALATLLRG